MSVTITIPTALRQFAGGLSQFEVEPGTAGEALNQLSTQFAELKRHLYDDKNKLRSFVNIYVNDEDIRFLGGEAYAFQDGDEIMLIPSIAGGTQ